MSKNLRQKKSDNNAAVLWNIIVSRISRCRLHGKKSLKTIQQKKKKISFQDRSELQNFNNQWLLHVAIAKQILRTKQPIKQCFRKIMFNDHTQTQKKHMHRKFKEFSDAKKQTSKENNNNNEERLSVNKIFTATISIPQMGNVSCERKTATVEKIFFKFF